MGKEWIRGHAAAQFETVAITAPNFGRRTIRAQITTGLGGDALRLVLAQYFGADAVYGSIKLQVKDEVHPITFQGNLQFTVPSGSQIAADPISVTTAPGDVITLWMYFPEAYKAGISSIIPACSSAPGDFTGMYFSAQPGAGLLPYGENLCGYCGLDILTEKPKQVTVVLGDSITAMELWTKPLQESLLQKHIPAVLLNTGIGGNRLLYPTNIPLFRGAQVFGISGLDRMERDALNIPGVTSVILALGVNDISQPGGDPKLSPPIHERCTPEALFAGFLAAIDRCHAHGLKAIGCTITPFGGYLTHNVETDSIWKEVNHWIRTSGAFDKVIDFAAVTADPAHPSCYLPEYDSGDHLHPSSLGGKVMAEEALRVFGYL